MTDYRATVAADGFTFLEGPRWHDGALFASDFFSHRVLCFTPAGVTTVCEVPGRPSGLGFLPDGSLLVVSMLERRLYRFHANALEVYADLAQYAEFPLNDLLVDSAGGSYVGNLGFDPAISSSPRPTMLLRVEPGGIDVTHAADDVIFPNGMALTADGSELLVAETYAARISAFPVRADGGLGSRRTWADFSGGLRFGTVDEALASGCTLPDGMAMAADGAVWLGDANSFFALRLDEDGTVSDRVETVGRTPYATAVGGPNGRTIFLCAATPLQRRKAGEPTTAALYTFEDEQRDTFYSDAGSAHVSG